MRAPFLQHHFMSANEDIQMNICMTLLRVSGWPPLCFDQLHTEVH